MCRDYHNGSLILNGKNAGAFLSYHPFLTYDDYVIYDKTLRDNCCTAGLCHEFLKLRPPQDCSGYVPPNWGESRAVCRWLICKLYHYLCAFCMQVIHSLSVHMHYAAWAYGDPHITTLDGRSYTFNGWGEYVMLDYTPQNSFKTGFAVQARTTFVNVSNFNSATKLSALAFGIPGQITFQVSHL